MTVALTVGILVAGGVYLILRRELLKVTIGFVLLGHAVNLLFVTTGGLDRRLPALLGQNSSDTAADPLPQAFVLTAIVITFGITVYLLALMRADGLNKKHGEAGAGALGPEGAGDGRSAKIPPERRGDEPLADPLTDPEAARGGGSSSRESSSGESDEGDGEATGTADGAGERAEHSTEDQKAGKEKR